eukprot:1690461-Prymnesium_polylepis.1
MFGFADTSLGVRLERRFLSAAFTVADCFAPLSWSYSRSAVSTRETAFASRDRGRTIPATVYSGAAS